MAIAPLLLRQVTRKTSAGVPFGPKRIKRRRLRKAIGAFGERVTVHEDHIEVTLKINPADLGLDTAGSGEGTRTPDTAGMNRML
ncbi:MAG: hypothetical protein PWP58_222 [Bacillota bacterium]|nr:hypothetical protein [Bacillota bacterium]